MIEQGRLPAKKVGGRWVVERADLHVDEAMQQRSSQKQARFKAVIEDALTPIAAWLQENRELRLNPKRLVVEPTRTPAVFLGYRVSRAGITPSRKLRRRFRQRLRSAATQGEKTLVRSIRSYQGLLLFPH